MKKRKCKKQLLQRFQWKTRKDKQMFALLKAGYLIAAMMKTYGKQETIHSILQTGQKKTRMWVKKKAKKEQWLLFMLKARRKESS